MSPQPRLHVMGRPSAAPPATPAARHRRFLRLRTLAAVVALLGILAASCSGTAAPAATIESVAPPAAHALLEENRGGSDFVLLDVRTPQEFAEIRLDGAVLIDFYEPSFRTELEALDRDTTYLVYCRSGNRSGSTLEIMEELGFTEVYDIAGGIVDWHGQGLPVVAP